MLSMVLLIPGAVMLMMMQPHTYVTLALLKAEVRLLLLVGSLEALKPELLIHQP